MNPLRIHKLDDEFILINAAAELPSKGQASYWPTAAAALAASADGCRDQLGTHEGIIESLAEVEIIENEYASADLIQQYGFTAV